MSQGLALLDRVLRHRMTRRLLKTSAVRTLRGSVRWRAEHSRWLKQDPQLRLNDGSVMYPMAGRAPREATSANAELVFSTLDDLGVPYTEVRYKTPLRLAVAVDIQHRKQVLEALSRRCADDAVYATAMAEYLTEEGDLAVKTPGPLSRQRRPVCSLGDRISGAAVIRVWRFYLDAPSKLVYGSNYGCDIEFWTESVTDDTRWAAPRTNVAGDVFSSSDVAFLPRKRLAADAPPSVFDLKMIDDFDFPIDVVYTWVDSSDPKWRQKLETYSGKVSPVSFHEEASGDQRFRSRDELKYSLRSLSMYAPWVRHVYIVTDGQNPEFIDFDREGITLVDHSEIAKAPESLPVFNSSAIISWLHRVPGLSEHFIYMNDDVFIGRDIAPSRLFTPSGLARVFPSKNRRPFGDASPKDEPHINITRNIRALIEQEFGRSISNSVKHTPHAQLVSVHSEMEKRFPDAYDRTSRSRFRHHEDITPDQLFHYYAQATGKAIVGNIRYAYVNIGDNRNKPELQRLLQTRAREVFCLNDAPAPDSTAMDDKTVRDFLSAYFPVPSRWERQ